MVKISTPHFLCPHLFVPIAQRIERSPPEAEMRVRFLLGTLNKMYDIASRTFLYGGYKPLNQNDETLTFLLVFDIIG